MICCYVIAYILCLPLCNWVRCAEGQAASPLALVEDPEGWHVAGLRSRLARSADELAQIFEAGCEARDHGTVDLGTVHDRAAAIFTVRLAQFNPAAAAEDQDTATVRCMLRHVFT